MILSKWLRTFFYDNRRFNKLCTEDAYYKEYQKIIKAILLRPQSIVRLALLSNTPDVCLGFSVSEPQILHYVWCHRDNRHIGIAKNLIKFPFLFISHETRRGWQYLKKHIQHAEFNPALAITNELDHPLVRYMGELVRNRRKEL